MSNLKLWEKVQKTDPKYTKPIPGGAKLTAIGAQYQKKSATEMFGPMGIGWGTRNSSYQFSPDYSMIFYKAELWYFWDEKQGVIEISSDAKVKNDCMKSVKTDALTKGLSELGFNADVFMNDFSDNKYINESSVLSEKGGGVAGGSPSASSSSVITFGKHQGKSIEDVPSDYLAWLAKNAKEDDMKDLANKELQKRNSKDSQSIGGF